MNEISKNEYFNHALSDFVFDLASGRAIRHLASHGYTVKQIMEKLDFSAPYEKVRQEVWDTLVNCRTILLEEPGTEKQTEKVTYVEERGKFGKTSFRRVVTSTETAPQINWHETLYHKSGQTDFSNLISDQCAKNGGDTAYVSCDFGILKAKNPRQYEELLQQLDFRQQEYVEGLPWPNQRTYHCMNTRMTEIVYRLLKLKTYDINCYFIELHEKLRIL